VLTNGRNVERIPKDRSQNDNINNASAGVSRVKRPHKRNNSCCIFPRVRGRYVYIIIIIIIIYTCCVVPESVLGKRVQQRRVKRRKRPGRGTAGWTGRRAYTTNRDPAATTNYSKLLLELNTRNGKNTRASSFLRTVNGDRCVHSPFVRARGWLVEWVFVRQAVIHEVESTCEVTRDRVDRRNYSTFTAAPRHPYLCVCVCVCGSPPAADNRYVLPREKSARMAARHVVRR